MSYRLVLWSTDSGMREYQIDSEEPVPLLETLDRVGRRVVHGTMPSGREVARPSAKLTHARHHLRIARRLLEDLGEHAAAARATLSLLDIARQ